MKHLFLLIIVLQTVFCVAQDSDVDYSIINEASKSSAHLLPLFTIHGVPKNQNPDDTVTILVNNGYSIGYSKKYNQPLWTAYQVSRSKEQVDYERFPFFVNDIRLPEQNQIGTETFGKGYDRGHLAPNAAINKQYGKLSQMETFIMSNISPQKAGLNQGVWQKLEAEILNKYCYTDKNKPHVWVLVGPIFSENPEYITRKNGVKVAIPDAFFCILVRPFRYPQETPSNAEYLSFVFGQDLERKQQIDNSLLTTINEIERLTNINFFPDFTRHYEKVIENGVASGVW